MTSVWSLMWANAQLRWLLPFRWHQWVSSLTIYGYSVVVSFTSSAFTNYLYRPEGLLFSKSHIGLPKLYKRQIVMSLPHRSICCLMMAATWGHWSLEQAVYHVGLVSMLSSLKGADGKISFICEMSGSTSASWSASWWMPGVEPCAVADTMAYASSSRPGSAARPHGWRAGWWRGTVWPPCHPWLRARVWPAGSLRWGPLEPSSLGKASHDDRISSLPVYGSFQQK